jgi:predicted permease
VRFISTPRDPVFLQFVADGRILGFTAAVAVLTGLLFGMLPALRATRVSLVTAMKGGHQIGAEGRAHFRPGRWIVAGQIALSLVLLIVAGLFLRSFNNLVTLDAGFDRSNVLIVKVGAHNANIPTQERPLLWREVTQRLQTLPGVISASESLVSPLSGGGWNNVFSLASGGGPTGDDALSNINYVSPEYFATLRSALRAGRNFDERDSAGAPLIGIVNETMAGRFFGTANPIGQYLRIEDMPGTTTPPIQIVGILKDAKYMSLREMTHPTIYFPIAQLAGSAAPASVERTVEEIFAGVNHSISLNFRTLEDQVNDSLRQDQLLATLSGFFGGLALLLATIGLYGTLAYMVTQRRKEIGIRMALGAQKGSILRLILRDVSILLLAGSAVGVAISLWATQVTQKLLFGLDARDAKTIALSVVVLSAVALIAGFLPARRATRLDPNAILRDE